MNWYRRIFQPKAIRRIELPRESKWYWLYVSPVLGATLVTLMVSSWLVEIGLSAVIGVFVVTYLIVQRAMVRWWHREYESEFEE